MHRTGSSEGAIASYSNRDAADDATVAPNGDRSLRSPRMGPHTATAAFRHQSRHLCPATATNPVSWAL